MEKIIGEFSESISEYIESRLSNKIDISYIKNTSGKTKSADACLKKGNFIYYIYNEKDELIYIGETGTSVKNRLFNHGSGAHKNKQWFRQAEYIKYYKDLKMTQNIRKLIERALILEHKKTCNLYNKD